MSFDDAPCPRIAWERLEEIWLAPGASRSSESRGRAVDEPPDPIRTAYQRDRDRILHCRAFRRLKHKTQVFINPAGDHVRTRLTHTLEVSQVARTISRALRLNEDLTESIALAHDLGHPPFGHAGETALDDACRRAGLPDGFRHVDQSLRVVEVLETSTRTGADVVVGGLNLTWEVREGIAHHSKGRSNLDAHDAELPETLEGSAVRIADRIAYVNHDIDDAVRSGILAESELPEREMALLGETHSRRISVMVAAVVDYSARRTAVEMAPDISAATDSLKEFLFQRVYLNPVRRAGDSIGVHHVIESLFEHYLAHPEELPPVNPLRPDDALAVRVCDFVAGMTDRYALSRFEEIFIPGRGLHDEG
ncbi:MAG: deoxyguanosinetriphosphate triphosphohydrolase [Armatimonadetes bacterium]|nr:deoxyguanosinetriphosphate triphosphohydrolase [Armatimonadota bacterium]MDE2206954.1 deoxyguanosinetriphosphate triphosphohydrolase [Armatimonadota bacterium]